MSLAREEIVKGLVNILGEDRVITDETVLKESSIDRYRKFEQCHEVYTQPIPAAVVYVKNTEEVRNVLMFANENGVNVVPRTGHSAIEGGLETALENSVVIDGSEMNQVLEVNKESMQVTCQCGVPLQSLEDSLREQGLTTGHSPQSKPLAQMGGLVATRSIGQFSTLYGGIEDMLVGCEVVFPGGQVCRIGGGRNEYVIGRYIVIKRPYAVCQYLHPILAPVRAVGMPLDDDRLILHEQIHCLVKHLGEYGHFDGLRIVLEHGEAHRIALLRRMALDAGPHAPEPHQLTFLHPGFLQVVDRRQVLQCALIGIERMTGYVEAGILLFPVQ